MDFKVEVSPKGVVCSQGFRADADGYILMRLPVGIWCVYSAEV
jgi:hypothetical protein